MLTEKISKERRREIDDDGFPYLEQRSGEVHKRRKINEKKEVQLGRGKYVKN